MRSRAASAGIALALTACCLEAGTAPAGPSPAATAAEIRREATLPNNGPAGRPLPLAASWNTGVSKGGYDPDYQLRLIEQGHRLWPWFQLDLPEAANPSEISSLYYWRALRRCAELSLPIAFIGSQWERLLTDQPKYRNLPPEQNPNVALRDGNILPMVSPFGPLEPWTEAGRSWTGTDTLRRMQQGYPNPPRVLFVSNNEHPKLSWGDADKDKRYRIENTPDNRRRAVGDAWIKHYRALQAGLREGLINSVWRENARFIGYGAFGGSALGRWPGWVDYSLHIPNRMEPWPLAWDGASLPYYLNDWEPSTDHTVWSPQIEAMNWVFMLDEAYRLNPEFFLEMSIWDGYQPGAASDKRAFFAKRGMAYTPERHAGMLKFGMWLLRPRLVREYRGSTQTRFDTEAYFMEIVKAVDEIHENPVLRSFWREGILVPNTHHGHPYQAAIPAEYQNKNRWFMLDTDLDPKRPWDLKTELPVFALALVKGEAPRREWLVYVFAPLGDYGKVVISLPGYGDIETPAHPVGGYRIIKENHA